MGISAYKEVTEWDIEEFVLHKYEYFAKCKTIASQQAEIEALEHQVSTWENAAMQARIQSGLYQDEIEKLRSWVEMLVEVPFFDEIDHYRGIPVSILRKAEEK